MKYKNTYSSQSKESNEISKIRGKKGNITIDTNEIQKMLKIYLKKLYPIILDNLKEIYEFLCTCIPHTKGKSNLNKKFTVRLQQKFKPF